MSADILKSITAPVKLSLASSEIIIAVQKQLNRLGYNLATDGILGAYTLTAFNSFKASEHLGEPGILGPTTAAKLLEAKPVESKYLCKADYEKAAEFLNCDVAAIKAVVQIEANGGGFFTDGRPKILFEAHWFDHFTKGKYRESHPNISSARWNRSLYKGGVAEYSRLDAAKKLNNWAALMSASWGLGQVMGMNHKACGYSTVEFFVQDMYISEGKQLLAMCGFIKSKNLDDALRARNWSKFAYGYNGESYAAHAYHTKLASAYQNNLA